MGAATRNCQLLSTASPHSEVYKVEQKVLKFCYQCGKTASNCYFKDVKWHNCDKLGNIAKVCHSKSWQQPKNCKTTTRNSVWRYRWWLHQENIYIRHKDRTKPPQVIMVNLLRGSRYWSHSLSYRKHKNISGQIGNCWNLQIYCVFTGTWWAEYWYAIFRLLNRAISNDRGRWWTNTTRMWLVETVLSKLEEDICSVSTVMIAVCPRLSWRAFPGGFYKDSCQYNNSTTFL